MAIRIVKWNRNRVNDMANTALMPKHDVPEIVPSFSVSKHWNQDHSSAAERKQYNKIILRPIMNTDRTRYAIFGQFFGAMPHDAHPTHHKSQHFFPPQQTVATATVSINLKIILYYDYS